MSETLVESGSNGVVAEDHMQALVFSIGAKLFAMDITRCRDVSKPPGITSVPLARDFIGGIVNIRGEIITVFELPRLLGYPDSDAADPPVVIRVKTPGMLEALRADAIVDTVTFPLTELEEASYHLSEHETKFISHVAQLEGKLVLFIDVGGVFDQINRSFGEVNE